MGRDSSDGSASALLAHVPQDGVAVAAVGVAAAAAARAETGRRRGAHEVLDVVDEDLVAWTKVNNLNIDDCVDSTSWYAKKPSKDCDYVAKKSKR